MPLLEDDTAGYGQCIRPLTTYAERGEILVEDQLDWVREDYGDPALVLPLWTDGHVVYALNFNRNGPCGEPSVIYIDFEGWSNKEAADSFDAWLDSLLPGEAKPLVQWDNAQYYELIAREKVQCDTPDGPGGENLDQQLCQARDQLVLFTRTTSAQGERLEMVTLPKDIDPDWATIAPFRPEPCRTFALHLQPRDLDDIEWATSRRGSDGKWKNERSRGVPIYCQFESKDQAKLEKLRARLLGGKVPKKVVADEEMQRRYEKMSEEERRTAFAQQLLAHVQEMDRSFAAEEREFGPVPDELKLAMGNLELLKKRMVEDLQRRAAGPSQDAATPKQGQRSKAPPARSQSSSLSPEDETYLSRYETLSEKIAQTLASVVDEATALAARPELEATADELAILAREAGTRFESEENQARAVALQMRVTQGFMRIHEQVYRIQHGVPDAGRHLLGVLQRLLGWEAPGPTHAASPQPLPARQQTMEVGEGDPGTRLARIVDRFTEIASAVSDDRAAEEAVRQMGSFSDQYRALFGEFVRSMVGIGLNPHLHEAERRMSDELSRIQGLSPSAHRMLEDFYNQLVRSSVRPENPESEEAKLVARLNEATRRLVETLKTVEDKPTAKAALADLDRLTADYLALYGQLLSAISRMEGVEIGILWQQHGIARAELQQELNRLQAWFRPAYGVIRHLIQRLREAYLG
jgi:hypothetical protein